MPNSGTSVASRCRSGRSRARCAAGVDRQRCRSSSILDEQADVGRADVADGDEALLRLGGVAAHRVVAVGAARDRHAGRERRVPANRHLVARLAAHHVVAEAVGLDAELQLVRRRQAYRRRCRRPASSCAVFWSRVTLVFEGSCEVGPALQAGRDVEEPDVVGRRPDVAGHFGHVGVVLVGAVVAAADAEEQLRRRSSRGCPTTTRSGSRRSCRRVPAGSIPFSDGSRPSSSHSCCCRRAAARAVAQLRGDVAVR